MRLNVKRSSTATAIAIALIFTASMPAYGVLTFAFNPAGGTPQNVQDGFAEAADLWSAILSDNVTVNIDIDYQALGAGILGQASSTKQSFTYTNVRNALNSDKTSANDNTAVAALPATSAIDMLINYTDNSPFGSGDPTPYLDNDGDANNTTIRITTADAKALGLRAAADPATDASITFSSLFSWDFDRGDGITPGTYDFVGVAAHEIGHAMGFVSGVDILDFNSPNGSTYYNDNVFTYVSMPDLFRFSNDSYAQGAGTIDWTANTTDKFFSLDGGQTSLVRFSTGKTHGDGQQASHWKDSLGLGLMDPTAGTGELLAILSNDTMMFDIIGWDLASEAEAVPEPTYLALLAVTTLAMYARLRNRGDAKR